jgi:RHS repeat-associated protein
VKASQTSAIANTHLYTGRERDAETGLQLNRHRFYASHMGRWVHRDPAEIIDGMNLYQYLNSNPISSTDPLGLLTCRQQLGMCLAGAMGFSGNCAYHCVVHACKWGPWWCGACFAACGAEAVVGSAYCYAIYGPMCEDPPPACPPVVGHL